MDRDEIELSYEVEDYLRTHEVFLNGLRGTPCHMDSYMTVVDFNNLDAAIAASPFSEEQVRVAINVWRTDPNSQPPIKIVASSWERALDKLKQDTHEIDT